MTSFDLSPLFRQWIGFDELTSALEKNNPYHSFPPYNIEKVDDNHYQIVLALAGLKQHELSIEQQGSRLIVQGKPNEIEKATNYIHQGIARRTFELHFTLANHMRVNRADFKEGLLQIKLVREAPEELLPQKIAIEP